MKKIILFLALIGLIAFSAKSQTYSVLTNALSSAVTDTVTNTGTGLVQIYNGDAKGNTTSIVFKALEISGTTAGTIALHGSNDGVSYGSIHSTTFTATDVTTPQTGTWQLTGNPFRYYRVTWTGSGTMSATISATLFTNHVE